MTIFLTVCATLYLILTVQCLAANWREATWRGRGMIAVAFPPVCLVYLVGASFKIVGVWLLGEAERLDTELKTYVDSWWAHRAQ